MVHIKQLDSEKGEKSRITKALEEAKKNLDEALQNPLTIEVEKEVFVTPPEVIERQLAHEDENRVRAAYNRSEYLDQRRGMMRWWWAWCEGLMR